MGYDDNYYWFWLCNIPGLGNQRIENLLNIFDNPREIYNASESCLKNVSMLKDKDIEQINIMKKSKHIFEDYLEMKRKNIKMIKISDEDYPNRLKNIYDRPVCLYLKGKMPDESIPAVAIVGARECSEYGRQVAFAIGHQLGIAGVNVISGMAKGVDGAAHKGALSANGYTLGVLANGVDVCYPRGNIEIYTCLESMGGILSEYPPSTEPIANHFPLRNRIISGLSDIVVVVEAREKSGSLITVDMALEQNRLVMAVPGRINDKLSAGCNNLIKLGAGIVSSPRDILELLNLEVYTCESKDKGKDKKIFKALAREEKMLYSCVDLTPKNMNNIIEETGLELPIVMEGLVSLEFKGLIKEVTRGYYVKTQLGI